jgi:hypothetical protein
MITDDTPRLAAHRVVQLARAAHSFDSKARMLAVLDYVAYIDDSGTDRGQKVVAFAGFLSTAREWARFANEWAKALAQPPAIRCLCTADLLGGYGEFKGWSWPDKKKKLDALVKVICRRSIFTFGRAIYYEDYEAAIQTVGELPLDGCIGLCFLVCCAAAVDMLPKSLDRRERIGFVIDRGESGIPDTQARLLDAFKYLGKLALIPERIGSISFDDKTVQVPLQAADLIAHHTFEVVRDQARSLRPDRGFMRPIIEKGNYNVARVIRQAIETTLRQAMSCSVATVMSSP